MNDTASLSSISALSTGQGGFETSLNSLSSSVGKGVENPGQVSFADALSNSASEFAQSVGNAENAAIAGIKGDMGAYEVVSKVMEAEQQLRMVTAVRDRMVQAYLEISRMQI